MYYSEYRKRENAKNDCVATASPKACLSQSMGSFDSCGALPFTTYVSILTVSKENNSNSVTLDLFYHRPKIAL